MAKAAYYQKGEVLDYTNNTAESIAYNDVVVLGSRIGVAAENIPVGGIGSVSVVGVYEVPADATTAFVTGDALYWDKTNGKVIKTAGGISAGWAFNDKAAAGATVLVKIGGA